MAKFKVVSSSSKLKTIVKGLPDDPAVEGEKFKALRGLKKGDTTETIGIFFGTAQEGDFNKEKTKLVSAQIFQGMLKRSAKDPQNRLILVSPNAGTPLTEVARECIKDASLKHKVVSIKPGGPEPDNVDDDQNNAAPARPVSDSPTTPPAWKPATKPSAATPSVPTEQPRMDKALEQELTGTVAEAPAATDNAKRQEEMKTLGNYHGNMSRVDAEKALNAAVGPVWLLRYTDNAKQVVVSCKDAGGTIKHEMTIDDKTLVSLSRDSLVGAYGKKFKPIMAKDSAKTGPEASTGVHPELDSGAEEKWRTHFGLAKPAILKVITATVSKDKAIKDRGADLAHQLQTAEQAAGKKEFGRALSLLALAERSAADLLKEMTTPTPATNQKAAYDKEKAKTDAMFKRMEEFAEIPAARLAPARKLYTQATSIEPDIRRGGAMNANPDYGAGVKLFQQIQALEPTILDAGQWEKQIDIKRYGKGKALKHGAFGEVYLLKNNANDAKAPPLVYKLPLQEKAKKELVHEEEVYKAIGDHPNIGRCLGMKTVDGQEGLVMEAISGGDMAKGLDTLRERVESGEIKHEEFWGVMQFSLLKSLEALDYMASQGFSHVDIKPDNIMFDDKTGEPKLVDMGLAAVRGAGGGGTPGYMSPEAGSGEGGSKADVFSVGATAYKVGEQKEFAYNRPDELNAAFSPGAPRGAFWNVITDYGESDEDALHKVTPGQASKPATLTEEGQDPGRRKKTAGKFAANTEYTKFVNWLMNPDPTKRPSAREALEHPFLKDRILPEDQCRKMIRELHK